MRRIGPGCRGADAPSLSSAVIRGTPWARSVSWTARIRIANTASAATRAARADAAASQA